MLKALWYRSIKSELEKFILQALTSSIFNFQALHVHILAMK